MGRPLSQLQMVNIKFRRLLFVQMRDVISSFVTSWHCNYAAPTAIDDDEQRDGNVTNFESLFDILYATGELERDSDDRGSRVKRAPDYDDTGLPPIIVTRMQQVMVLFVKCCRLKCSVADITNFCFPTTAAGWNTQDVNVCGARHRATLHVTTFREKQLAVFPCFVFICLNHMNKKSSLIYKWQIFVSYFSSDVKWINGPALWEVSTAMLNLAASVLKRVLNLKQFSVSEICFFSIILVGPRARFSDLTCKIFCDYSHLKTHVTLSHHINPWALTTRWTRSNGKALGEMLFLE